MSAVAVQPGFGRTAIQYGLSARAQRACSCGGRPTFRSHQPEPGGAYCEIFVCPRCGNSVGPRLSRHELVEDWGLGGWKAGGSSLVRECVS